MAVAETLQQRLLQPLHASIKEMEATKKHAQDEAFAILKELSVAEQATRRNAEAAEDLGKTARDCKVAYEAVLRQAQPRPRDVEKVCR